MSVQSDARLGTNAIELVNLHKNFKQVQAVRGMTLSIAPGEIVALLGPNGAGKTTTIDMILGLSQPSSGSVSVYGMQPRQAIDSGRVSAVLQTSVAAFRLPTSPFPGLATGRTNSMLLPLSRGVSKNLPGHGSGT